MSYHTDDLELASDFQPLEGEANFGPTLTREVVGGAHIAPHCIVILGDEFVLVDWSKGLPRHGQPGKRAVRFPHGLMQYGESYEETAARLVSAQMGLTVTKTRVIHVYSYLDETPHWHQEPILLTRVTGSAAPPVGATLLRCPIGPKLPEGSVWAGKPPFAKTYEEFIEPLLGTV